MKYIAPHDQADCGPACVRMISNYYGKNYSSRFLQKITHITRQGVSLLDLSSASEEIGFKTLVGELTPKYLKEKGKLPCILFWNKGHFVVLYNITTKGSDHIYHIADPGRGKVKLNESIFKEYFIGDKKRGYALFLEPTPKFYTYEQDIVTGNKLSSFTGAFKFLLSYFLQYKHNFVQVFVSILIATFVSFLFPFLTQSIIDNGIGQKDISLIILILLAQLSIFVASTITEIVRTHLLLHIGARVNLSILSDFLLKLMKLPISFFDSKMAGDLMERISDHKRIESFITSSLLTTIFSVVTLIVYSFILGSYSINILLVFFIGSFLSVGWSLLFMRWRKSLDYKRFHDLSRSHDKLYEMAEAMPEIKLNSFEDYTKWDLEELNIKLFRLQISGLKLEQYQQIGTEFFNQLKNILIVFIAAIGVINSTITLGMMLAISYIMGQLNVPIKQFVSLFNSAQSTKIALERMSDVYQEANEESKTNLQPSKTQLDNSKNKGIKLDNVSFQYGGPQSEMVLKNISVLIPEGKVTAIVGSSGSGKTTLLKLLLKFYPPSEGKIKLNGMNLSSISSKWWREQCGTVMQEGYIFSDSIKRNVMMSDYFDDPDPLIKAVETANIGDFIADLPLHFDTKIGKSGIGLSTGQKQRIQIARAVYKDPSYLFFDEATSSLDAKNEKEIMDKLNNFFEHKTVIVVAHRLSTVKNADQILVLEDGEIIEKGTHGELVKKNGFYYTLIKNQLELGS